MSSIASDLTTTVNAQPFELPSPNGMVLLVRSTSSAGYFSLASTAPVGMPFSSLKPNYFWTTIGTALRFTPSR